MTPASAAAASKHRPLRSGSDLQGDLLLRRQHRSQDSGIVAGKAEVEVKGAGAQLRPGLPSQLHGSVACQLALPGLMCWPALPKPQPSWLHASTVDIHGCEVSWRSCEARAHLQLFGHVAMPLYLEHGAGCRHLGRLPQAAQGPGHIALHELEVNLLGLGNPAQPDVAVATIACRWALGSAVCVHCNVCY